MNRSPYLTDAPSVTSIMLRVLLALVPGIAAYVWVFGGGILLTLALASVTALGVEALMLKLRKRPVRMFVTDGSALVTAWLLALALPPLAPWWLIVLGTAIAIVLAKQLYGGQGIELIAAGYLLGGLYLIQQRIITWHLPTAFLASIALIAAVFYLSDASRFADPAFHLFSGATMLCAFFIITDPVSGPTTPRGKLIFAAGIGLMTYIIRVYGGYPDGVAFAVIFFNICVPLIDAYTQPRVFGHEK